MAQPSVSRRLRLERELASELLGRLALGHDIGVERLVDAIDVREPLLLLLQHLDVLGGEIGSLADGLEIAADAFLVLVDFLSFRLELRALRPGLVDLADNRSDLRQRFLQRRAFILQSADARQDILGAEAGEHDRLAVDPLDRPRRSARLSLGGGDLVTEHGGRLLDVLAFRRRLPTHPPVEPVIADAWLGATPGATSTTSIGFTLAPQPKAFPTGASRLETTVAFRSKFSGTSTDAQPATLQRASGKLDVDQPAPVTIKGPQGGPFAPPQVTYKLAAQGLGFRWQSDTAPPTWLELAPAQGELHENASVSAVVKLRPAVQSLGPGTYESKLHFKNAGSNEVVERLVRIVVEPRAQLPPGKLALDAPPELKFTGAQGGPFAPQSIPLKLKATGAGFKWTAEGAPPWLELAPAQGELRENGSMDVTARMRPTAQTLTPATYEGRITFKKTGPDQSVVEPVRLVVSISFR
jgi:hypothetical protein